MGNRTIDLRREDTYILIEKTKGIKPSKAMPTPLKANDQDHPLFE